MHVVAENSPEALRERELLNRLTWALRELTANLMRISRGAGKPVEVGIQAEAFVQALGEYQQAFKLGPPVEAVSAALRIQTDPAFRMKFPGPTGERLEATDQMMNGALQMAASRLLKQKTHESRGSDQLFAGLRWIQEINEEQAKARKSRGPSEPQGW